MVFLAFGNFQITKMFFASRSFLKEKPKVVKKIKYHPTLKKTS
jgi:hypothetical protein